MDRRSKHLSSQERGVIFAEHIRGSSQWAIGRLLVRPASTIGRELAQGRQGDGRIETAKLNAVNPHTCLTDTLTKLVNRWPASRIDGLMPWAYVQAEAA